MIRLCSFLSLILVSSLHVTSAEEPIRHSFFVAGPSFTGIIDEDGKEAWNAGRPAARDGWVLEIGNVLVAWSNEVKEFTRDHKVVFHYKKSDDNKEIGTVQRLDAPPNAPLRARSGG